MVKEMYLYKNQTLGNYLFVQGSSLYHGRREDLGRIKEEEIVDFIKKNVDVKRKSLLHVNSALPDTLKSRLEKELEKTKISLKIDKNNSH